MKLTKSACVLVCALVCLSYGTNAWAQGGTGALTGLVFDPSAAVVAGAKVSLTNSATGAMRNTETSSAGAYRFVALPIVGTYTLKVEVSGFRTAEIANIVISVGSVVVQDVHLELGTAIQTVEVSAEAQLLQTSESAISTLVDRRMWENMPLETRSQNAFINMAPGAVPDAMAGSTRGAAVNGARGGTGNYLVEGTDNNDQGQGGRGQLSQYDPGGAGTSISPDAIQEYRIITNSFAAEYGKAGGFVTDTVLRSGTNQWHGSLFEYNRTQALAANSFFSNRDGIKDSLVRNQFGGSVGGPIVKDKTFFFFSTEFHRARQSSPASVTGTTQEFLDWADTGGLKTWAETSPEGLCNNQTFLDNTFGDGTPGSSEMTAAPCPGAFANSATVGSLFKTMKGIGPFPLGPSQGGDNVGEGFWTGGLVYPVPVYSTFNITNPQYLNEYRISAKVDHKLSDQDQLSGYLLLQNALQGDSISGGETTIGPRYTNPGRGVDVGLTWNHTFSPSLLNTFRASYLRHRSDFPSAGPEYDTMPAIATAFDSLNVGFGMYSGLPQFFTDTQFQYQDHLTFTRGKHSFKAGAEYRRTRNGSAFFNDNAGTFLPYGIEDLVTDNFFSDEFDQFFGTRYGSLYYESASVDMSTGKVPEFYRGFRANEMAAYFQDDWRITSRLTINWGLRWEYFGPPHNFRSDLDSNFYWGTPVTPIVTPSTNPFFPKNNPFYARVATGTFQQRNHEIWGKDTNNFAPRLGFAYDVRGNRKLVLRAGAGIMYDRIYNNVFENIRFNPPFFSDNQIGTYMNGIPAGGLSTPGVYTYPFTTRDAFYNPLYAPKPNPRHMDQDLVSPFYEQMHVGLQWQFANGYMFEPEYIHTAGRKLIGYYDINNFDGRTACNAPPYSPTSLCALAGFPNGFSTRRVNNNIGADNFRNNAFRSNYNSLQLAVRKTYSRGLAFNVSYTYAKTLDTISDLFNFRTGNVGDTMNVNYDYGPSDYDMRHRFLTVVSYDLPIFRNNQFTGRVLGGWTVNTIISLQSGVPFTVYDSASGNDKNKDGRLFDRLVTVGGVAPMSTLTAKSPADGYFDTTQWARYTCPATVNGGLWCNVPLGRNSMYGPSYQNVDFSFSKKFGITERVALKLQGGFFNLFNHANFALPTGNRNSSTYGLSTGTYDPRIVQLALRLDF
jgi:hypothetical protein